MRGNFKSRKPYETKSCLGCGKEFGYINGNPNKKFCDNKCQHTYKKNNNLYAKPIPYSKEFLEELYITNKISVLKIAIQLNTNLVQVSRWLKRYSIPTRPFSTEGLQVSLGMKRSLDTRKKISDSKKGEKSYTWKGGVTPINKKARQTFELKLWREAVLERDDYTCQFCGIKKGKRQGMEVDHIKSFARFPELRTSIENGRTLCNPCHRKTDTYGMRTTIQSK